MVGNDNFENEVNESRFYMWRTLFAVAHADNIVTDEEIAFMAHILEDIQFSEEQTSILKGDIMTPKDVELMFDGVTDSNDRTEFFDFARDLVWVDGDFALEEQSVMVKLLQTHFKDINVDDLVGNVTLEFEEDSVRPVVENDKASGGDRGMMSVFRRRFFGLKGKK